MKLWFVVLDSMALGRHVRSGLLVGSVLIAASFGASEARADPPADAPPDAANSSRHAHAEPSPTRSAAASRGTKADRELEAEVTLATVLRVALAKNPDLAEAEQR